MCSAKKNFSPHNDVLEFTYPRLHTGKNWYVDFMAYDPAAGKMKRKKYMLDSVTKITERRKRAAEMIEALTKKLRGGWSPWVNVDDNRGFTPMSEALDKYSASVEKFPKYKTRKSYQSKLAIFRQYLSTRLVQPKYVYQFDTGLVSDFLDWVHLDRECNARTRNNYRQWCSSLAVFFMERQYISSNPVDRIKVVSETPKIRKALTHEMLKQLASYLKGKDPFFLLACKMEYYTFIRPTELSFVKIEDISIKDQTVFVTAEVSKNKRNGKVGLNSEVIKLMIDIGIFSNPGDFFMFGQDMRPNQQRASSEIFRRKWLKVRQHFGWGEEYQFYSLKDSGIRDLANSKGIVIARDQARHTDVSTTNKYLEGQDLTVHPETTDFIGYL